MKSLLLEKHERLNYLKEIGKIKDEAAANSNARNFKAKEFDINYLDNVVNIHEFDDPLLLH